MTASRPIGARICAICEHLEAHGPAKLSTLQTLMPDVERSNLGKYCSRAVGLGLLTLERKTDVWKNRHVWTVVPNWRELVQLRRTTRIKPLQRPKPANGPRWKGISSVFQMGTMG